MTLAKNTFNTGQVDSAVGTSSANGDAFTTSVAAVVFGSNGINGTQGAKTSNAASAEYIRKTFAANSLSTIASRVYFKTPASYPTLWLVIWAGRSTTTKVASFGLHSTGNLRLYDQTSPSVAVWESTATLDLSTWYLLELVVDVGAGNATGTAKVSYRKLGDAAAIQEQTVPNLTFGGPTGFDTIRFGKNGSEAGLMEFDEPAWNDGSTTFIGPEAAAIIGTPTDNGPLWKIDATSLTGGAGALTHSISPSSGVVESSEGVFWVPQNATATNYTVTTTDGINPVDNVVAVPAIPSGVIAGNIRHVYTGSVWD